MSGHLVWNPHVQVSGFCFKLHDQSETICDYDIIQKESFNNVKGAVHNIEVEQKSH